MKSLICEEYEANESRIDSSYFGIPSAKVVLKKACMVEQNIEELLCFCKDFEFITITNVSNDPINNIWIGERTKAFLVDVNTQFRKELQSIEQVNEPQIVITDHFPENNQVVKIANSAFKVSRFINDPYLAKDKAKGIYADIVGNAFGKPGRYFVVDSIDGEIAGFNLFSMDEDSSSCTIELIAVNESFTKMGVGRKLIQSMEGYVFEKGINTIFVGTQVNNFGALNFYRATGFQFNVINSIYHYWPAKQ